MLHTKYRPTTFDEFLGNKELVNSLQSTIGNVHAYMFYGLRGSGKTTLSRIVAKELGCSEMDIHEINMANKTGVDDARDIESKAKLSPIASERKVYILDEFHRATGNAQDSMLKLLEEPPKQTYFCLCTTEPQKVIETIRSRTTQYEVGRLKRKHITALLTMVAAEENIQLDPNVLATIVKASDGIPREALVILEKVKGLSPDDAVVVAKYGSEEDEQVINLCRMLLSKQKNKWIDARHILQSLDEDSEKIRRSVLGYLSKVALSTDSPYTTMLMLEPFLDDTFQTGKAGLVYAVYKACRSGKEGE